MTICIDCRSLARSNRTGVDEVLVRVGAQLLSGSSSNTYIVLTSGIRKPELPPSWTCDEITHVHIPLPNKVLNLLLFIFRRPYLDAVVKQSVDWVVAPNILFSSWSTQVKTLLIMHDLSFEIEPRWYSWKRRLWHRLTRPKQQCLRANRIVCPSQQTKDDVVHYFGVIPERISVVPWGVHDMYTQEAYEAVPETYGISRPYILSIGTLEPRKNIGFLVEAYQAARLHEQGYDLIIAGSSGWCSDELQKKIMQTNGVRYLGYIPEQDKPGLYHNATLFVYPSLYEGYGLPPLEAAACGTPLVVAHSPGVTEVSGSIAHMVHPKKVDQLAFTLSALIQDPQRAHLFVEKGKEYARARTWDAVSKEIVSHIV